jgi:hypothetical protein
VIRVPGVEVWIRAKPGVELINEAGGFIKAASNSGWERLSIFDVAPLINSLIYRTTDPGDLYFEIELRNPEAIYEFRVED